MGSQKPFKILLARRIKSYQDKNSGARISVGKKNTKMKRCTEIKFPKDCWELIQRNQMHSSRMEKIVKNVYYLKTSCNKKLDGK